MICNKHNRAPNEIATFGVGYCLACELEAEIARLRAELRAAEYQAAELRRSRELCAVQAAQADATAAKLPLDKSGGNVIE